MNNSILEKLAKARDYFENPQKYLDFDTNNFRPDPTGDRVGVNMRPLDDVCGTRLLGAGCYAWCYQLSDKLVLKITKRGDVAYRAWANYVRAKNGANPYLPRIYYRTEFGNSDDYQVYVIEHLFPIQSANSVFTSWFQNYFENLVRLGNKNPYFGITCPKLQEVVDEFGPENFNDASGENIMFRVNPDGTEQPVISDPCSAYQPSGRKNYFERNIPDVISLTF
jgi:hypothetical protein